ESLVMSHHRFLMAIACALTINGTTCSDDDPVSPSNLSGTYTATSFRLTANETTTNILQTGGTVSIQLTSAGTTIGSIHVPPLAGEPAFDADLSGTWSLLGNGNVRLQHSADTFLRDMELVTDDEQLIGDRVFGAVQIRIELTKNQR